MFNFLSNLFSLILTIQVSSIISNSLEYSSEIDDFLNVNYDDTDEYEDYCSKGVLTNVKQTCCPGYIPSEDGSMCNIVCEPPCENGVCIRYNRCICSPGYIELNHICSSRCLAPCVNGKCVGINVCECDQGYTKHSQYICAPKCTPACINGVCMGNNICECYNDYKHSNNSFSCEPICNGCENGFCFAPGECACSIGYKHRNVFNYSICDPICEGCEFGKCVKPNICECNDGYEFNDIYKSCLPICEKECVNSICADVNFCKCLDGFLKINNNTCVAVQDLLDCHAKRGYLITTKNEHTCTCHKGYHFNNNTNRCESNCNPKCIHGHCTEPGKCECQKGYVRSQFDSSVCKKNCSGDSCGVCENCDGICLEDGICICPIKTEESGNCVPLSTCDHNNTKCICRNEWNKTQCELIMKLAVSKTSTIVWIGVSFGIVALIILGIGIVYIVFGNRVVSYFNYRFRNLRS